MNGPLRDGAMRWREILHMVRRAEQHGFDSFWLPDHLLFRFPGETAHAPWETWSLLSALAASTTRIELGTAVLCAPFRSPALIAKMADTIDEVSGGRVILGLGAGWHEPEFAAFGLPFDRRVARFEEAVRIITTLLRTGHARGPFEFTDIDACELRPRGPRPGGPPVMIGALANGPRMLEISARYADLWAGWLTTGRSGPSALPPLLDAIDAACADVGRDPDSLGRVVGLLVDQRAQPQTASLESGKPVPLSGTPEAIAAAIRAIGDMGVSHVPISTAIPGVAGLEALAPVLPLVRT